LIRVEGSAIVEFFDQVSAHITMVTFNVRLSYFCHGGTSVPDGHFARDSRSVLRSVSDWIISNKYAGGSELIIKLILLQDT
jgi:hypothetical protein